MASSLKWILRWYFCFWFLNFIFFISPFQQPVANEVNVTPFIRRGQFKKARQLSLTTFFCRSKSYSGFLTIEGMRGRVSQARTFFWVFPSRRNITKVPVMLWLQGGPGVPAVYGSLAENGPCVIGRNGQLKIRRYSWTRILTMIYIDNPVGSGYSWTNGTFPTTQVESAHQLYDAVQQLLDMMGLRQRPFYIGGESYGGKFVTSLAYKIHKSNQHSEPHQKINLQGVTIGNGLVDPPNMLVNAELLHQLGFIDDKTASFFKNLSSVILKDIKNKNWVHASHTTAELYLKQSPTVSNVLSNITQYTVMYNMHYPEYNTKEDIVYKFANMSQIKVALHVGDTPLKDANDIAMVCYYADLMQSVISKFVEVAENYNVLLYNGQLDMIIPYIATINYVRKMKWSQKIKYANAPRKVWKVDKQVAGYSKTVHHRKGRRSLQFTEMLISGAGHLVVIDRPSSAFQMISEFIASTKHKEGDTGVTRPREL